MPKKLNLIKLTFGKLEVIKESHPFISSSGKKLYRWECLCSCGNKTIVLSGHLRSGKTKSCRCLQKEIVAQSNKKHGLSGKHPLYVVWANMKSRCYNKNNRYFKDYGGRGIKVCKEWKPDFKAFYDWALDNGWKRKLQIDRRENNFGYSPDNCRFVSSRKNCLNRRLLSSRNKSNYEGVCWDKKAKKWTSSIRINYKLIYLRSYPSPELAAKARNQYIIKNNLQHEYKIQEIE